MQRDAVYKEEECYAANYHLANEEIKSVNIQKDLGIFISDDLKWSNQIAQNQSNARILKTPLYAAHQHPLLSPAISDISKISPVLRQ
jgi:hypothetical protein